MSEKSKGIQQTTKAIGSKGMNPVIRKSYQKGAISIQDGINPAKIKTIGKK